MIQNLGQRRVTLFKRRRSSSGITPVQFAVTHFGIPVTFNGEIVTHSLV